MPFKKFSRLRFSAIAWTKYLSIKISVNSIKVLHIIAVRKQKVIRGKRKQVLLEDVSMHSISTSTNYPRHKRVVKIPHD